MRRNYIDGDYVGHSEESRQPGIDFREEAGALTFIFLQYISCQNCISLHFSGLAWPDPSRRKTRPKVEDEILSSRALALAFIAIIV